MLDNTITLPVDATNAGTPVDKDFRRISDGVGFSNYQSENHTMSARETLVFSADAPKPHGNFPGVARSSTKYTKDITVTGNDGLAQITAPIIIKTTYSIPKGATEAQVLEARQHDVALTDYDAVMNPLNLSQEC